jgi:hypothetical protein
LELSVVRNKSVACLAEDVVVVKILVSLASERRVTELLSTAFNVLALCAEFLCRQIVLTTEDDIVTRPLGPGVVDNAVNERVNDGTILTTVASVGGERGRCSIGNVSGGNNTDLTASETSKHLKDGLELRVVERIGRSVGVHSKGVDSRLVSSVEGSSGVGRVGDERIDRVGHLVTELQDL